MIAGPVAGVAIYFLTRWLLVAVVLGLVFTAVPALKSKQRLRRDERGLADAIATWTEQLRDTLAGAHGLEQAIVATSNHAPVAISSSVRRLSAQIQYGKLSDGLRRFADDVDHPIADFVSASVNRAAINRPPSTPRPAQTINVITRPTTNAVTTPSSLLENFMCRHATYQ